MKERKLYKMVLILTLILPLMISFLATSLPLEDYLSEIGFRTVFSWYVPWRGAVVGLLLWIVAGVTYTGTKEITRYFLWGSYIAFALFHYATLYMVIRDGYNITLYPFVYVLNYTSDEISGSTYYLDLAQILLLINLFVSIRSKRNNKFVEPTIIYE